MAWDFSNFSLSPEFGAGLTKGTASLASFGSAVVQYNAQQSAIEHQKAMADIQAAAQMAAINEQEREVRDATMRAQIAIQMDAKRSMAQADASAAAAGTAGGSVEQTIRGLNRSEAAAESARKHNYETQRRAFGHQKEAIKIGQIFANVPTLDLAPDPAAALLDLTTTLLDHNKKNSPEGESWLDRLG